MVDPARSRRMSAIKGKDTKPELIVRKALYKEGIRYRLHGKNLPGRPDLVLSRYRAIILINGCFWHKHNCHLFNPDRKLSPTWASKIEANVARDRRNLDYYLREDWRVMMIWECAVIGKTKLPLNALVDQVIGWLKSDRRGIVKITGV